MRSRWPSLREQYTGRAAGDFGDTLESGEHGLDGCRVPGPPRRVALRVTAVAMVVAAGVLFALFVVFSIKVARERAIETLSMKPATDSPCTHFKSDMFDVISVPNLRHGMVAAQIISVGSTVVQSGEVLELPECMGKRIQRARHMTIGVKYQPLETWPFGRSHDIALNGEQAVCVQHAIDQFKGTISCDST
jgi:hypothetical protein